MGIHQNAVQGGLPLGVLPTSNTDPRGCWEVYQCLPGSFPGAPPSELPGCVCPASLLPPHHSPPTGRVAPQGGFPTDLTGINLSDWAILVQDVTALPPGLSNCLGPEVVNLLQLLEVATGVGFCHCCCNPEPHCRCVGVPQLAPPTSWSQILEQTPGYGMTSSDGGVPTPSTSLGGMPRLVPPSPGLSIWNLFQGMVPTPWQPGISPLYRPPIGRADRLKAVLSKRGLLPWAP